MNAEILEMILGHLDDDITTISKLCCTCNFIRNHHHSNPKIVDFKTFVDVVERIPSTKWKPNLNDSNEDHDRKSLNRKGISCRIALDYSKRTGDISKRPHGLDDRKPPHELDTGDISKPHTPFVFEYLVTFQWDFEIYRWFQAFDPSSCLDFDFLLYRDFYLLDALLSNVDSDDVDRQALIVKLLKIHQLDIQQEDLEIILDYAIQNFKLELLEYLIHQHTDIDLSLPLYSDSSSSPLKWTCKYNGKYTKAVMAQLDLLLLKVDPSATDNYALRIASEQGRWQLVERLLKDSRVNPKDINSYSLRMASKNGHLQVVYLLLQDSRADPAADNNFSLVSGTQTRKKSYNLNEIAARNGHYKVVDLLAADQRVSLTDQDCKAHHLKSHERALLKTHIISPARPTPKFRSKDLAQVYDIEKIMDKRALPDFLRPLDGKKVERVEYLVKWVGYETEDATWVPYHQGDPEWQEDDLAFVVEFEEKRKNLNRKTLAMMMHR